MIGPTRDTDGFARWTPAAFYARLPPPFVITMRILSLHSDAYGGTGGIAQYNRDLLDAFCRHPRVDQVVALPRIVARPLEPMPETLVFETGGLGGRAPYARALARWAASTPAFDLVFCAHVNLLPLAWPVARLHEAPIVLAVYGIDVWQPTPSRLVNVLVRASDAIMSISQITLDRMDSWAPLDAKRTFVCPNAIDTMRFVPGPRPANLVERYGLSGKKVLLTVARLHSLERYKGVDETIEILPRLRESHPSIRYLVVGDGPDRERLEQKARELGVDGAVVFAGWVNESEKVEHYQLADAYVMPGRGEGFGFVYLEALACGIPVVASRLDGSREAVRQGMLGELVDPTNPDDILRGILAALEKPRGVVPAGLDYFEMPRFVERYHQLIDTMVPEQK